MPHPDPSSTNDADGETCWLCERPLGALVEVHHPVPRAKKGRRTVPVHPICHRTIHGSYTNSQLARMGEDVDAIRAHPEVAKFLAWIANKPPDFHAPVRKGSR